MSKDFNHKDLFNKYLHDLHEQQGIALKTIASKSGINYPRLRQIRHGKSSGRFEDVLKIENAYPELKGEKQKPSEYEQLRQIVKEELEDVKKLIMEMTIEQRLKFEQEMNKQLGERIKELEERLAKREKD